jgi:tetratricopeptide (TPR) repeat protein
MDAFLLAFSNPLVSTQFPNYPCWAAPVEEAVGRQRQADDLLEKGGHFVECYRFKGDILDGRGRWPDARNAYAEAIAAAPDLPAGYYSLGLALARHGDLAGALDNLKAAIQRGPHWADPLKAWGDILGAQGRWDEALAKYRQALAYAPNWVELLQARDRAAARGGRP